MCLFTGEADQHVPGRRVPHPPQAALFPQGHDSLLGRLSGQGWLPGAPASHSAVQRLQPMEEERHLGRAAEVWSGLL